MIKFRFSALVVAISLWSYGAVAQAQQFLSLIDDLPLITGLEEVADATVYFDTPKGRIVEVFAVGPLKKETVLTYYKESLPSLGWQPTAHGTYLRDGEYLNISVKMDDKTAVVRFALSPDAQ